MAINEEERVTVVRWARQVAAEAHALAGDLSRGQDDRELLARLGHIETWAERLVRSLTTDIDSWEDGSRGQQRREV